MAIRQKLIIPVFDGKNFDMWKFQTEILLTQQEVPTELEKKTSDESIVSVLSGELVQDVEDCKTTVKMWKALQNRCEKGFS